MYKACTGIVTVHNTHDTGGVLLYMWHPLKLVDLAPTCGPEKK